MPYIYSEAWQVTSKHGTLMRPLVMDWRDRCGGAEHGR